MAVSKTPEFLLAGAPRQIADSIEQLARAQGNVTALVVPWESTGATLSMAVTLVKSDGWAIEHTNLGTVTLTPDGDGTRVGVVSHATDRSDTAGQAAIFERFAQDIRQRLATA